jgi:hypothetical protein
MDTFDTVRFSTWLWSRSYAAMQLITVREKGQEGLIALKYAFMNGHGSTHFLAGLDKLGIRNDPPALAGAKYHYMSNCLIGDVPMEYVRETDRKAWIRYLAPSWAMPGSGIFAYSAAVDMAAMNGWHRNNGKWLGCPRLAYVVTKLPGYGDPYVEGYFMEHDAPIPHEQALRYEPVTASPGFDPAAAPTLDPAQWPEARVLKARRKYAENYSAEPAQLLFRIHGVPYGAFLLGQAMVGLGTQYANEIVERIGLESRDAKGVAGMFHQMLRTLGDRAELAKRGDAHEITRTTFSPIGEGKSDELYDAYFAMFPAILKVLTARVKFERRIDTRDGGRVETWRFSDSAVRLL